MPGSALLTDVRIADMTTVIFGPYCTQILADMGAEVVKLEPPEGDEFRKVGKPAKTRGMGPCHLTINRGKKSVIWDMKSPGGRAALQQLVARSDVFIHNIRPDAVARLGLTFEDVRKLKPDIVYVHCLGFGSDGPYAGRPAYDDLIQSLSGATKLLSRVDGNEAPRFLPTAFADKVSGLHAVYATLAALRHRDRTGEAVHVEVPMFECVTSFLLEEHFFEATLNPPTGPFCYQRQVDPSRQPLRTLDGWITIAPYVDHRWVKLFEIMGASEELADDRLNSARARHFNNAYMLSRVQARFVERSTEAWLKLLLDADIPAARVNDFSDLQTDPHLEAVGFFRQRTHPSEGDYWETQPPVRFVGIPEIELAPAPAPGQHSDQVIRELESD